GPIDSDYANRIQRLSVDLGLADRVHFAGMLTGDAKWGAFYGCEAFVLPSHQENFGIAVVEALSCGKPVLISDQVNIYQEIQQADAGLVRPDTIEGTLSLLDEFTALSGDQRVKMGIAAREGYEEHFSIQQAAGKLHQVLASH
ncbi:MAG: glycosyltransferase, partial [Planctomycetota bacterium]